MGKKKVTAIDDSQKETKKEEKKIFRWEEAYTELSPKVADALKEARLKPEQLEKMADGEILAIEGVGPAALEEIRAKYPATLAEKEEKPQKKTTKKEKKEPVEEEKPTSNHPRTRRPRFLHGRSSRYEDQKKKVEKPLYELPEALKTLRDVTYSVHKTVELHLNTKDVGLRGEISLPHSVGKETKIVIFTDDLATKIKASKIDFDILLAKPADMGKIAPLAKVLGPKGLMPNPKSNTIVNDPEKRKAELEKGATLPYRTEPKAPIIHLSLGNLDQKDEDLQENITAVISGIGVIKLKSAFLKTTMSPAIKLDLTTL